MAAVATANGASPPETVARNPGEARAIRAAVRKAMDQNPHVLGHNALVALAEEHGEAFLAEGRITARYTCGTHLAHVCGVWCQAYEAREGDLLGQQVAQGLKALGSERWHRYLNARR